MNHKYIRLLVLIISVVTIVSGAVQIFSPAFVLSSIHGVIIPATNHEFAMIGMFMVLFGGIMLHSLYSVNTDSVIVLWSGLQKLGASAAVFLAIRKNLFAPVAAFVAGFDLLSSLIFFYYYRLMKKNVAFDNL